jgi:hypothetical protein
VIGMPLLVSLRKAGRCPALGVIVWVSQHPLKRCTLKAIAGTEDGVFEVVVGIDEVPELLDLRALHGLAVVVSGDDEARCNRVARCVFDAGGFGAITNTKTVSYTGSIEEAALG